MYRTHFNIQVLILAIILSLSGYAPLGRFGILAAGKYRSDISWELCDIIAFVV